MVTFGGPPGRRMIPGLGASIRPPLLDESYVDEVVRVEEADTVRTCHRLARRGFLFGGSTGTVVSGAIGWLARHGSLPGDAEGRRASITELTGRSDAEITAELTSGGGPAGFRSELGNLDAPRAEQIGAAYRHDCVSAHRWIADARARQPPDPAATLASGRRRRGTGGRVGPDAARAGGMPAVTASSSAQVRAASARPARASSSSLVIRPCANASFSASITCSRSACDARMGQRPTPPAAISSPGPAIAGTSPPDIVHGQG
jgi:hypothetical protein